MEGPGARGNPEPGHNVPENSTPTFILDVWYLGVKFLERYGWLILFALVFLVFLWSKLKPHLVALQKKWEQQNEIANFDPVKAAEEQERIEIVRRRWQEQQDAKAAKFMEDKKLLEEEKRKERIEDWDRHQEGKGYRSKKFKPAEESTSHSSSSKPKKPSRPLRPSDFSPLSGGGGGGFSYRPPRRGAGGGG